MMTEKNIIRSQTSAKEKIILLFTKKNNSQPFLTSSVDLCLDPSPKDLQQ